MTERRKKTPSLDLSKIVVRPSHSLIEAMRVIDTVGVELALVCDEAGKVVGTLSDGDIRRAILRGVPIDQPGVSLAMQPNFVWVTPLAGRAEVLDRMRALNISQVPVLDSDGKLAGLHLLYDLIGGRERPNAVVIMAGGKGTRLRPLTENIPKPMLTVAGRPILERIVLHLVSFGIREIYLSINYLGHMIEEHFGDGSHLGAKIKYLREERPLGTGGALSLLPERPSHPLLVMNGDLITELDVPKLLAFHERGGFGATMCLRPHQVDIPFGVAEVDGDVLTGLREKPAQQYLINAGIYAISPEALDEVPQGQEFPITQLFERCLERKQRVGAFVLDGEWLDVGRHETLRQARGVE